MKEMTIDLFKEVKFLSQLKHQGNYLSYIVSTSNMEKNCYESSIYLYDMFKKNHRKLTSGKHDQGYLWLNDEEIIFKSKRDTPKEKVQKTIYYKINIHGGEAESFIELPYLAKKAVVVDKKLYFLAPYNQVLDKIKDLSGHEQADYIKSLKEDDDYDVLTEIPFWSNGNTFTEGARTVLYCYDMTSKTTTALTKSPFTVMDIHYEEEFGTFYVIGQTFENMKELHNELYQLKDNKLVKIGLEEAYNYRKVVQLSEKELIVYGSNHEKYGLFENGKFGLLNLETNDYSLLTPELLLASSNAVGSDLRIGNTPSDYARVDDKIYFMLLNNFKNELMSLDGKGTTEVISELPGVLDEYVYAHGTFYGIGLMNQDFQELYDLKEKVKISSYNTELKSSYDFVTPEHFTFDNRDGLELDGFIMIPNTQEKKLPTILNIHGGPKTAYGDILYHEMQYFASQGYVVIYCNPRGSDGKTNDFADIRGKYGTIEYEDIMDFVDEAIKRYDIIDDNRMGVTGGSYGGFMTNWIIGHTNRFKAAATQRSISNWFSFFGTSDIGYYFGPDQVQSTPWDNSELMWEQSPIKYADQIETPTLIIHSHNDYRCWTPDGYQMFTALKYHNVPSKMVLFKGENHELSRSGKPKHRIRRLKEIIEWMDIYLK